MQYVGWRKMRKMLQGYRTSNRPDLPADVNVRGGGGVKPGSVGCLTARPAGDSLGSIQPVSGWFCSKTKLKGKGGGCTMRRKAGRPGCGLLAQAGSGRA
jgi:hypothetical protein